MRVRLLVLVPLVTAVALGGAASAAADPVAPQVTGFHVLGGGPDDLYAVSGTGFTPSAHPTLRLVGDDGTTYDLATLNSGSTGLLGTPSGSRTPEDLPRGTYRPVVTDPSGATTTGPSFTVSAPSATARTTVDPGDDAVVDLAGLGGGSDVFRTVTVDGAPTAFESFEDASGLQVGGGRMGVRYAVPGTALAGSRHDVVVTQDRHPAATVTTTVTVSTPGVYVPYLRSEGYGNREGIFFAPVDFGPDAQLTASLTDAAHRTFDLGAVHSTPDAPNTPLTLPGLAPGTAVLSVTNSVNGAVAHAELPIATATTTAPNGLAPGGVLLSPDGNTRLMLGADGNLVVARQYLPKWSSATTGRDGANLVPLPDGSWGLKTRAGAVVWSTRSPTTDRPTRLTAQADGNVVLYSAHGRALWSTRTAGGDLVTLAAGSYLGPNGRLRAGIGDYTATMQTDGTFLIVRGSDAAVTFRTPTGHNPGAAITLQPDGNLVVYSAAGKALWANGVRSGPGSRLVMQLDGNLVEYSSAGKALWATNTARR